MDKTVLRPRPSAPSSALVYWVTRTGLIILGAGLGAVMVAQVAPQTSAAPVSAATAATVATPEPAVRQGIMERSPIAQGVPAPAVPAATHAPAPRAPATLAAVAAPDAKTHAPWNEIDGRWTETSSTWRSTASTPSPFVPSFDVSALPHAEPALVDVAALPRASAARPGRAYVHARRTRARPHDWERDEPGVDGAALSKTLEGALGG